MCFFMQTSLSFFKIVYAVGIVSNESLPTLRSQRFTRIFSIKSFISFALTFRSVIHFEFGFVYGVR